MRRRLLGLALVVLLAPISAAAQGETVEYYGLDAIGSVRIVFDAAGNVVTRMDYTPFGGELFGASGLPDQRFAGLFRDGEAGLDYAQARSYQVRTGRFNAPDPVYAGMFDPQRWNRYSYAVSSPFSFVDPTGLQDKEVQPQCKPGAPGQIYYCPGTIRIDLEVTVTAAISPSSLAISIAVALSQPSQPSLMPGPDWGNILATRTGPGVVITAVGKVVAPNSLPEDRADGATELAVAVIPGAKLARIAAKLPPGVKEGLVRVGFPKAFTNKKGISQFRNADGTFAAHTLPNYSKPVQFVAGTVEGGIAGFGPPGVVLPVGTPARQAGQDFGQAVAAFFKGVFGGW